MTILLDNVDVDTTSTEEKINGGSAVLFVRGDNYGGGAINVEVSPPSDQANRFDILNNGVLTEDTTLKLDYLPNGIKVRVDFTGSSGASNVFVELVQ